MVANPPAIDATIMVEQVSYLLIYQSPACFTEFDATIMVEQLLAQKGDIFSSLALAACPGKIRRIAELYIHAWRLIDLSP